LRVGGSGFRVRGPGSGVQGAGSTCAPDPSAPHSTPGASPRPFFLAARILPALGAGKIRGWGSRVPGGGRYSMRRQSSGCRVQGAGCRVQGAGCRVQDAGSREQGAGCRVQGAGFRVQGLVMDLGLRLGSRHLLDLAEALGAHRGGVEKVSYSVPNGSNFHALKLCWPPLKADSALQNPVIFSSAKRRLLKRMGLQFAVVAVWWIRARI